MYRVIDLIADDIYTAANWNEMLGILEYILGYPDNTDDEDFFTALDHDEFPVTSQVLGLRVEEEVSW